MAVGCILLSVGISLWALRILLRGRPATRVQRAVWISFYFTVPFELLDWLYCGVYLGHGAASLAGNGNSRCSTSRLADAGYPRVAAPSGAGQVAVTRRPNFFPDLNLAPLRGI